ncbi:hypothetical protein PRUPE_4G276900 [Prunus persica]|uniref:peroxidase n=1 Tax=Prunus persica TaxID=3760 RepID=M5X4P3_PRUPE|nr:hypothetical protein PRUPE_4G276900 [Prunus persica]
MELENKNGVLAIFENIGCEFIQSRLHNFRGTGKPDPTVSSSFFNEMRVFCEDNGNKNVSHASSPMASRGMSEKPARRGMSYSQQLSSSVLSGAGFDTHYYQSLLRGRGLLFADQQLMANERTARLMSNLNVLTGSQGQVRLECTLPVSS